MSLFTLVYYLLILSVSCTAHFLPDTTRHERVKPSSIRQGRASRGAGNPGYIKTRLRREFVNATQASLARRWGSEPITEFQAGVAYLMDIDVGTPRQTITVIVDTGSWELFLNPNCTRAADPTFCVSSGHYNPVTSSTARNMTMRYYVTFGTGGYVGDYFSDTLWFDNNSWPVRSLQFGDSNDSDYVWAGIIGLGYGQRFNTKYPTLIDLLVSDGYIQVPIFSLGVGSEGSGSSEIVVGGVDTHKYSGWLEPLALYPPPQTQKEQWNEVQYWVNLTSLGYTAPGQGMTTITSGNFSRIMMIDTGSTYSYIDADLVAIIAQQLGATIDDRGVYYVPCSLRNVDGYVNFGFNNGSMIINAKYHDFIISFGNTCALGVQPADAGVNTWVLGDTFIRSAYIVFDQLYDAVWLANYAPCGTALVTDLTQNAGNQLWTELYGGC